MIASNIRMKMAGMKVSPVLSHAKAARAIATAMVERYRRSR